MNILLDANVFAYSNLGFCFFHNGTHLLKLNKKIFVQTRTNAAEAERLIKQYPTFFVDPRENNGGNTYEQSIVDFSALPEWLEPVRSEY